MYIIAANYGNKKHYIADTESDKTTIPLEHAFMGSTCFVIDSQLTYMLNSNKEWKEVPTGTSSVGAASVVYEGGGV